MPNWQDGTRQDEDCQEGGEGDHGEVLHQADPRLPHQQEDHRGSGAHPLQASPQQDCRVYHPLDEEAAEEHRARHLDQAAGGGEGEKGQLRPRRLRPGAGYHRGRCRDQGDAEDDGLPVYPRSPDDHCWSWRWQPQLPGQPQLKTILKHYPGGAKMMIASINNLFNLCLGLSRMSSELLSDVREVRMVEGGKDKAKNPMRDLRIRKLCLNICFDTTA